MISLSACREGRVEDLRLLLAAGADVNQAHNNGRTPLYWASRNGKTEVVKLLLAAPGIDVNQANNNGFTPLSIASVKGHAEVVKLLLGGSGHRCEPGQQWATFHCECEGPRRGCQVAFGGSGHRCEPGR